MSVSRSKVAFVAIAASGFLCSWIPACQTRHSSSASPRVSAYEESSAPAEPKSTASGSSPELATEPRPAALSMIGPGFEHTGPWVSFYGTADQMGDLARVARAYRIINIDADPGAGNFTDAQLVVLRGGGKNHLISYFNIGACEHYRTYWSNAGPGIVSCGSNATAQRGSYEGYPDETWMDLGNPEYQRLILDYVAPRLAARVDGFYLDNLEILEHSSTSKNGPCSASCRQGGLDLIRKLREKFPRHLLVMQNATGEVTREGMTGGVRFATLLDGIAHEEVYAPKYDDSAEEQLVAWSTLRLANPAGRAFWIGVEDYVGSCESKGAAQRAFARARARGFSPYATDQSGGQKLVCFWD